MARRTNYSFQKRQKELKKKEKAQKKLERRLGKPEDGLEEASAETGTGASDEAGSAESTDSADPASPPDPVQDATRSD